MFATQRNVQMRVVCNLGCGYKSKGTYGSNATAEMSAAYRLAQSHARTKHGVHNSPSKTEDATDPKGFRITIPVGVVPDTP